MNIYQVATNIQFAIRIRIAELWHDTYTCATYLWIRFVNSIRKSVDDSIELIFIVSINIRDFYVNPGRIVSFLRFLIFTCFVINQSKKLNLLIVP